MSTLLTFITEVPAPEEIEELFPVEVEFMFTPGEPRTFYNPGTSDEVEILSVTLTEPVLSLLIGSEVTWLTEEQLNELEEECYTYADRHAHNRYYPFND